MNEIKLSEAIKTLIPEAMMDEHTCMNVVLLLIKDPRDIPREELPIVVISAIGQENLQSMFRDLDAAFNHEDAQMKETKLKKITLN